MMNLASSSVSWSQRILYILRVKSAVLRQTVRGLCVATQIFSFVAVLPVTAAELIVTTEVLDQPDTPHDGATVGRISLIGEIQSGDAEQLREVLRTGRDSGIIFELILLHSPGGVASEGIKIGRLIRSARLATEAPLSIGDGTRYCPTLNQSDSNCICASSCAIAWFGGLRRYGDVEIHRSYLSGSADFNATEEALGFSHAAMRDYLAEMRVPLWVADRMLSTPSSETVRLNSSEDSGIAFDPIFGEYIQSRCGPPPSQEDRDTMAELAYKNRYDGPISEVEQAAFDHLWGLRLAHAKCARSAHLDAVVTSDAP